MLVITVATLLDLCLSLLLKPILTSTNPFLAILILVVWGYGSGVEPLSSLHQALGSSPTTEEKSFYF